jgi:uncharacterized protein with FMN-binding domain
MRRALSAVALTIAGLYSVLSYKSSPVTRIVPTPVATSPEVRQRGTTVPTAVPTRTIDGQVVTMRWGEVQVAVTLKGTTITDVAAIKLPYDHQRSAYISDRVAPWLRQEVLQAQSARIDSISGATYTWDAYTRSLQSALDQAGV